MHQICEKLVWDSRFFGFGVARIKGNRLKDADMAGVLKWCSRSGIKCLYFLADADDAETLEVAERHGFGMKDVRVTLVRSSEMPRAVGTCHALANNEMVVRGARTSDVGALERIAENRYTDSRFYFDARFPREKADAMYRTWIRKSCRGYASKVLVLERKKQVIGFVTCRRQGLARGSIGLLGVSSNHRGQGAGECLVKSALRWFREQEVTEVSVVTQGRNIKAQRLYERLGFVTRSLHLWYHKWFLPEEPK